MWCVVCVVCDTLKKNVCTGTTRTCVFSMCAWCQHTRRRIERRRVEWTHGERGGGRRGRRQPCFFIGKQVFLDILEHLNRMLGSSLIANCLLTKICPHMGYHVLQRFTNETNPWILHILIIECSALARCNVLTIRNKNTLQTICSATFAPFLSCSCFFYFSMATQ